MSLHVVGKLRILAVCRSEWVSSFADVPTAGEAGVPNFSTVVWFAPMAPKARPTRLSQTQLGRHGNLEGA
jgi:tripartite-type tricarboxylate transporter receptor subunit TctC